MNGGNDRGLTPEEVREIIESERKRIDALNDPENVSEFAREFVKELRRVASAASPPSDLQALYEKAAAQKRKRLAEEFRQRIADEKAGRVPVNFARDSEYAASVLGEDDDETNRRQYAAWVAEQEAIVQERYDQLAAMPVDFLANPVRVQLPEGQTTGSKNDRRTYTRIDLIALSDLITDMRRDAIIRANEIQNLSFANDDLRREVKMLKDLITAPRVREFLVTLAQSGKVTDETDEDLY